MSIKNIIKINSPIIVVRNIAQNQVIINESVDLVYADIGKVQYIDVK